jgi:hypothetical protein
VKSERLDEQFVPRSLHYEIDETLEAHEGESTDPPHTHDQQAEEEILEKVHHTAFTIEEGKEEGEQSTSENKDLVEVPVNSHEERSSQEALVENTQ